MPLNKETKPKENYNALDMCFYLPKMKCNIAVNDCISIHAQAPK